MKATIIAALATSLLMVNASVSEADSDTERFIRDLSNAGFANTGGAKAEIAEGSTACMELASGWTVQQAAQNFFKHNPSLSLAQASRFVEISIADLCPEHAPKPIVKEETVPGEGDME